MSALGAGGSRPEGGPGRAVRRGRCGAARHGRLRGEEGDEGEQREEVEAPQQAAGNLQRSPYPPHLSPFPFPRSSPRPARPGAAPRGRARPPVPPPPPPPPPPGRRHVGWCVWVSNPARGGGGGGGRAPGHRDTATSRHRSPFPAPPPPSARSARSVREPRGARGGRRRKPPVFPPLLSHPSVSPLSPEPSPLQPRGTGAGGWVGVRAGPPPPPLSGAAGPPRGGERGPAAGLGPGRALPGGGRLGRGPSVRPGVSGGGWRRRWQPPAGPGRPLLSPLGR